MRGEPKTKSLRHFKVDAMLKSNLSLIVIVVWISVRRNKFFWRITLITIFNPHSLTYFAMYHCNSDVIDLWYFKLYFTLKIPFTSRSKFLSLHAQSSFRFTLKVQLHAQNSFHFTLKIPFTSRSRFLSLHAQDSFHRTLKIPFTARSRILSLHAQNSFHFTLKIPFTSSSKFL